jgi:ketosteroid isomerase-like protein
MINNHLWRPESEPIAAAIDHVRLSYCYLDDGDIDAYCSLFTEQVVLRQPGTHPVSGRAELERAARLRRAGKFVRHLVFQVFESGSRITAVGRLNHLRPPAGDPDPDLDFIDVFSVADSGLLSGRTSFLFTPAAYPGLA